MTSKCYITTLSLTVWQSGSSLLWSSKTQGYTTNLLQSPIYGFMIITSDTVIARPSINQLQYFKNGTCTSKYNFYRWISTDPPLTLIRSLIPTLTLLSTCTPWLSTNHNNSDWTTLALIPMRTTQGRSLARGLFFLALSLALIPMRKTRGR